MSKIQKIRIYPIQIPYKQTAGYAGAPHYDHLNSVIAAVTSSDGITGYGEAIPDPHFTGESIETVVFAIESWFGPAILGTDVFAMEEIHAKMDAATIEGANPSAKAALDMACMDLMGKITNQPVHQLLGGTFRSRVPQVPEIVFDSVEDMVNRSQEAVAQGIQSLKIKVGGHPTEDEKIVRAVREAVGEDVELTLDANQGWRDYWTALKICRKLERYNISVMEQPLRAHDLKGHANLRKELNMRIMLDESVCSIRDALSAIEFEACDIISVKLMKCGGLWRARQLVNFCSTHGLPCHMGTMWESEIGWAANLHVIAALPGICLWDAYPPSEIYWGLSLSIGTPIQSTTQNGVRMVEIPKGPGLGITVNLEVIKSHLIQEPSIIEKS